jgi:hypothetical protein
MSNRCIRCGNTENTAIHQVNHPVNRYNVGAHRYMASGPTPRQTAGFWLENVAAITLVGAIIALILVIGGAL